MEFSLKFQEPKSESKKRRIDDNSKYDASDSFFQRDQNALDDSSSHVQWNKVNFNLNFSPFST